MARASPSTLRFWDEVASDPDAPLILRDLVRDLEVTATAADAEAALRWAGAHPRWTKGALSIRVVRGVEMPPGRDLYPPAAPAAARLTGRAQGPGT